MPKTLIAACLALTVAAPAFAQSVDIDDDGWTRVAPAQAASYTVDIDDDRWTRVAVTPAGSSRGPAGAGECTQLERSAGLAPSDCGALGLADLVEIMADD